MERAVESVIGDLSFVNLISVHLSDCLSAENAHTLLKGLRQMFLDAGVTNAIFVPINGTIKGITIDKIEVERK